MFFSRLEECTSPSNGPRILFFSGGTALRSTAHDLTRLTHNSVHLITPFDSGGSSATLRKAFCMPAIGDVRSRIMALADDHVYGKPEIYTLFAYRLPTDATHHALHAEMMSLLHGTHLLLQQVPDPMNRIIREHLVSFYKQMPPNFPLAGANVGNLVLTAGYLSQNRRLCPVIALFSRMLRARGVVRPTVNACAHLAVRLESGEIIVGQHKFTGKEAACIASPIADIWLTASEDSVEPITVTAQVRTANRIRSAQAICYPVGSFYSSVLANLLPQGIGRAIAESACNKVFVPNMGRDPELAGHTIQTQVERLLRPLQTDAPEARPVDFLTHILVDKEHGNYAGGIPEQWLRDLGITVLHQPLVSPSTMPLADSRLLAMALYNIVENNPI